MCNNSNDKVIGYTVKKGHKKGNVVVAVEHGS